MLSSLLGAAIDGEEGVDGLCQLRLAAAVFRVGRFRRFRGDSAERGGGPQMAGSTAPARTVVSRVAAGLPRRALPDVDTWPRPQGNPAGSCTLLDPVLIRSRDKTARGARRGGRRRRRKLTCPSSFCQWTHVQAARRTTRAMIIVGELIIHCVFGQGNETRTGEWFAYADMAPSCDATRGRLTLAFLNATSRFTSQPTHQPGPGRRLLPLENLLLFCTLDRSQSLKAAD